MLQPVMNRYSKLTLGLALLFYSFPSGTAGNDAQPVPDASSFYSFRAEHSRDGIGKFYMGREIAHVMGHQAAEWLERPERQEEERTDLLIEALKLKPGEMVADIGAGTGYISEKMARRIVPGGVVYGVDIQQEMLDLLERKMKMLRVDNVK